MILSVWSLTDGRNPKRHICKRLFMLHAAIPGNVYDIETAWKRNATLLYTGIAELFQSNVTCAWSQWQYCIDPVAAIKYAMLKLHPHLQPTSLQMSLPNCLLTASPQTKHRLQSYHANMPCNRKLTICWLPVRLRQLATMSCHLTSWGCTWAASSKNGAALSYICINHTHGITADCWHVLQVTLASF